MRIALIALGSRGDVQPYVALGKGLQASGHEVRLVTHDNYERLVREHGLPFWPMRGNVQAVVESPEMAALIERGNFIALTRHTAREARQAAAHWAKDGLAACQGMDLLVTGLGGMFIGLALAEKLNLPLLQAHLVPFTPTGAFPSVLLPPNLPRLGSLFNRLSHHLTRQVMWQGFRGADKAARRQVLDLPPAPFTGPFRRHRLGQGPVLYGYSPAVIPKPADWGTDVHVTGYWFLDTSVVWEAPHVLQSFLDNGPPPVYVGFGSMSQRNPEATAGLVLKALTQSGLRAVILSGWGAIRAADLPDDVLMVESVPHAWLFPRMAAVVHHGGAGTTAAGLRAGVPSLIVPFFGDQFFWGQKVADLGVGPAPIPRRELTADRLAHALGMAAGDLALSQRAAALGEMIRSEDGIGRAVALIEQPR